jgi:pimeloyl-ACP methyl ester carboxylesterase
VTRTTTPVWLGSAALAAAAALRIQARRDRAAVECDPTWAELRRSLAPDCERITAADGTQLVVNIYGREGAPLVVFLHGWSCSARFWTRQIQALRESHRILVPDLRGHGRSATAGLAEHTLEALADDLAAVLRALLPPGERCLLVGHSMGAMTIAAWAARYPGEVERAAAIAFVNTGLSELVRGSAIAPYVLQRLPFHDTLARAFLATPGRPPRLLAPLTTRGLRYAALGPAASPAEVAFCEEMVFGCRARVRAAFGHALGRLDLRDGVAALCAPVAVVAGERDRRTPPAHAERLVEWLPQPAGPVRVIAGAGHMAPLEAAAEVTAVIKELAGPLATRSRGRSASAVLAEVQA